MINLTLYKKFVGLSGKTPFRYFLILSILLPLLAPVTNYVASAQQADLFTQRTMGSRIPRD
jgi:hypothetical protein